MKTKNHLQILGVVAGIAFFVICCNQARAQSIVYVSNQIEFQNALDSMPYLYTNQITCLKPITIISPLIDRAAYKTQQKQLTITNCDFDSEGTIYRRMPSDQTQSELWKRTNVLFDRCSFFGKRQDTAVVMCSMVGGGMIGCFIKNFDIAIYSADVQNALWLQNRFSICNEDFVRDYGRWAGSNNTKSNNVSLSMLNRHYMAANSRCAVTNYEGSQNWHIANTIEGGNVDFGYRYFVNGNTCKEQQNFGDYFELVIDSAAYKGKINDGDWNTGYTWIQTPPKADSIVFVDMTGSGPGSRFNLSNIPYLSGKTYFKSNGSKTSYNSYNVRYDMTDPKKWLNGLPFNYSVESFGTTWNHSFPRKSFRLNKEVLDSSVVRIVRPLLPK